MCVQRAGTYQSEHIPHPFIPFRIIQVLMQELGSVQSLLFGPKFGSKFSSSTVQAVHKSETLFCVPCV